MWLLLACSASDVDEKEAARAREAAAHADLRGRERYSPAPAVGKPAPDPALIGLSRPESVLHDPLADLYLISNVNGVPFEKDNNGFISLASPAGELKNLKWIAGGSGGVTLHAPKGTGLVGRDLYVSDIDTVRVFDADSGAPKREISVDSASFLNDIAVSAAGRVFVSDTGIGATGPTGTDTIWEIVGSEAKVFAKGPELHGPNGLFVDGETLRVATWNAREIQGFLLDGSPAPPLALASSQLDGLTAGPDGQLYVSSWEAGGVLQPGRAPELWRNALPSAADIGVDLGRNRLLVPLMEAGTVVFLPLHQAPGTEEAAAPQAVPAPAPAAGQR